MGSHEAATCRFFGRGMTAWTASLAATTLLAVGMIPVSEAVARPAAASLAQDVTATEPLTEVSSTLLAPAADLPGAAQAVAFTGSTVFVQVAGDSGPRVL